RKARAGLAKLVVAQEFFGEGENGDRADKKKSGVDKLGEAVGGLTGRDPQGWEALAAAAQDPTLEALPDHNGVMCGPAGPNINENAFEALTKATGTDAGDWAFPVATNLPVRGAPLPNVHVVE